MCLNGHTEPRLECPYNKLIAVRALDRRAGEGPGKRRIWAAGELDQKVHIHGLAGVNRLGSIYSHLPLIQSSKKKKKNGDSALHVGGLDGLYIVMP